MVGYVVCEACRDVPSDIPGLVTFKRIDPDVRYSMDCEGAQTNGVFARKLDNLVYDFIAACSVNCTVHRDYHGWDVTYSYAYARLAEWQRIHERLATFFDRHTAYLDEEGQDRQ